MINSADQFQQLVEGVKRGDNDAAAKLIDTYGPHVVRAIRRRIRSRKMRVLYNTEDCLQSVWGSVFCDHKWLDDVESPHHLVKFLARVACNKLVDQDRYQRAQRNDIYRECALGDTNSPDRFGLASPDPTPSQKLAAEEEVEIRTRGLSTEKRTIFELHRQGHSSEEIAAQTDYSGRGVRRVLEQVRRLFRN